MNTVLFLCTGNYYRSRFAEELFNHRVVGAGLAWAAQSRGLAIERGSFNVGYLSPFALAGLRARGLDAMGADRAPQSCTFADLRLAAHVVALDETEHRPLLHERFPDWDRRAEYWRVGDIASLPPPVALGEIERQIGILLDRLSAGIAPADANG